MLNLADRAEYPIFRGLGVRVSHLFFFSKGVLETWYYEAPSGAFMTRTAAKTSIAALRAAADEHLRLWPEGVRPARFALLRTWAGGGVAVQAVTHRWLMEAVGKEGDADRRSDWHSIQLLLPPASPSAAADGGGDTVYRVRMRRQGARKTNWEVLPLNTPRSRPHSALEAARAPARTRKSRKCAGAPGPPPLQPLHAWIHPQAHTCTCRRLSGGSALAAPEP